MQVIGVIPSRFGSTRFPGKPLAKIGGKPLLQWVVEGVKKSQKINKILVATDHDEIFSLAQSLDVDVVMTDEGLPSGSDRVWQAIQNHDGEVIVNIQGDEPLINGQVLDELISAFEESSTIEMATLAREIKTKEDLESNATAKIVCDETGRALYFSRYPIPYSKQKKEADFSACLKHIGIYAYQRSFLQKFCEQEPVAMELAEGLEQLRALYLGANIQVVKVDHDSWGVDYPEDVKKIEALLDK